MRIRKRQVPLPFSSLSPLPLPLSQSDPLLPHTPPVQLPPSSDPPNLHSYASDNALDKNQKLEPHDSRETTSNGVLPQSTSSTQGGGRWCEREKTFPLKKRRGSFERPSDVQDDDDEQNEDEDNNQTTSSTSKSTLSDEKKTIKTKMNKKCTLSQKQSKLGMDLAAKKRSRGGALMEGSRCSRVNGRGWRCCQQTLVGYSLCEHHLGKGRLRSMNNVRSRSLAAAATPKNIVIVEKEEKKPTPFPPPPSPSLTSLASKKRMKLGVVKARSISSLLGQPDGMVATPPPPPPPPTLHDDNINE